MKLTILMQMIAIDMIIIYNATLLKKIIMVTLISTIQKLLIVNRCAMIM